MEKSLLNTDGSTTNNTGVAIETSTLKATEAAPAVPDVSEPEEVSEKKKKRTVGNIIYDFGVFGSIAWGGVAILSAISAHEAMHGNNRAFGWLRSINNNVFGWLKKTLGGTILKGASKKTVEGYAGGTTMFVTLGMGGNALMAPIKWLEDNRQSNAATIDNALGTTPPDPETIAKEPKQTWKSVFTGRLVSWGTSYLAFLAMGPTITGNISKWFGDRTTDIVMKVRPQANRENVGKWSRIAAFDALFTVITACITYVMSRYVAKKDDKDIDAHDLLYNANPAVAHQDEQEYHPVHNHKRHTQREGHAAGSVIGERKFADGGAGHITEKLTSRTSPDPTQQQL